MSDNQRQIYTIDSFRTARCQARPATFEDPGLHWDIEGIRHADIGPGEGASEAPDLFLIAELFVHSTSECAAATVEAMLSYEDRGFAARLQQDPALALDEVQRAAGELCHLLYDAAADVVRTLATLTRATLEIPGETQEATVSLWNPNEHEDTEVELETTH